MQLSFTQPTADIFYSEKKSMAFTVTFAPKEEEFTTEAVDGYVKKILKNLNNKLGVELRS